MIHKLLAMAGVTSALCCVSALGVLVIVSRANTDDMPFADEIKCWLAPDPSCVRAQMTVLRQERHALEDQIMRLMAERDMLQGQSAVHTTSGDLGGWYASVSAVYEDPDTRTGLKAAMCFAARDIVGRDTDLALARWVDGAIAPIPHDPDHLRALQFTAEDITRGLAACPWPARS